VSACSGGFLVHGAPFLTVATITTSGLPLRGSHRCGCRCRNRHNPVRCHHQPVPYHPCCTIFELTGICPTAFMRTSCWVGAVALPWKSLTAAGPRRSHQAARARTYMQRRSSPAQPSLARALRPCLHQPQGAPLTRPPRPSAPPRFNHPRLLQPVRPPLPRPGVALQEDRPREALRIP
jgi:hypothetical protein